MIIKEGEDREGEHKEGKNKRGKKGNKNKEERQEEHTLFFHKISPKNPNIAESLNKLIAAGILRFGSGPSKKADD